MTPSQLSEATHRLLLRFFQNQSLRQVARRWASMKCSAVTRGAGRGKIARSFCAARHQGFIRSSDRAGGSFG